MNGSASDFFMVTILRAAAWWAVFRAAGAWKEAAAEVTTDNCEQRVAPVSV